MFYEYALEPSVLSNWERVRFFLDAFGPWKGRFLANYPRRWRRMVYEGLHCGDREKKRIEERLASLDERVFSPRAGAPYDGGKSWLENAKEEHSRISFRAIVAEGGCGEHVLDAAVVDEQNELWCVHSGGLLPREAATFVAMVTLLLRASTRIVLIDPHFRADQDDKTRPLVAFCRALAGERASLEVHVSDANRSYSKCMQDAARVLPRILPGGSKVLLRCRREKRGGPRLHNRYILTDVGGVQFGDGIEVGDTGHEDRLSILDEPSHARLWEQYLGASSFDEAGTPREFVGADSS
ncbi:hypothetical protein HJC22_07335 [Corallococcus exiguus]|uniref:hypothetical protein n=1 Tax=Corallococcus exiguus TaxID=83462 RepID=UPI001470F53E|nr:hypothetical protein [Corallococcus exiguus]NNC15540.1 hypothetical protein [Corallococcus exiguus]